MEGTGSNLSVLHNQHYITNDQQQSPFVSGGGSSISRLADPPLFVSSNNLGSPAMTGNKQHDELGGPTRSTQYSMPGILHFLQTEWARFEMDRAQWEIDRAELQVILRDTFDYKLQQKLQMNSFYRFW